MNMNNNLHRILPERTISDAFLLIFWGLKSKNTSEMDNIVILDVESGVLDEG